MVAITIRRLNLFALFIGNPVSADLDPQHFPLDESISLLQLRATATPHASQTDLSLLESKAPIPNKRCVGQEVVRKKFDTAEACKAEFSIRGDITNLGFWGYDNKRKPVRGLCLGWGSNCKKSNIHKSNRNMFYFLGDEDDEASAVGDPHITTNTGAHFDLTGADLSLLDSKAPIPNKRCVGQEVVRKKFDTAEACKAEFSTRGDITNLGFWGYDNKRKPVRGLCLGWGSNCKKSNIHKSNRNTFYFLGDEDDEASAVGDPHITTNTGAHFDLTGADLSLLGQVPPEANKRCKGTEIVRKKFDTAEACIAEYSARGDITNVAFYATTQNRKPLRGLCLGWGSDCKKNGIAKGNRNTFYCLVEEDEAAAVGDPHITTNTDAHFDLPDTDLSMLGQAPPRSNKRCKGTEIVRKKFDTADACIAEYSGRGDIEKVAFYATTGNRKPLRGLCLGWGSVCKVNGIAKGNRNTFYDLVVPDVVEEASAVGDPHLTTNSGAKADLCCEGGKCHPCPAA